MKTKNILEWTGYADDDEVEQYMNDHNEREEEDGGVDTWTLEEAQHHISMDSDYWSMQWDFFCEALTEMMKENTYWKDNATNMGWQSRQGFKVFKADNGMDFLRAISPDTDCSYTIQKTKTGFKIRIGHHDAPMGEHHVIKHITEAQYEKLQ